MKNNKVDFDFQFRVRKYIEYIFREESDKKKEDKIFQKLSKPIKDEFFNQMYGKKLNSIPFFKQNFSALALKAISTIMKKVDIAPEETVLKVWRKDGRAYNDLMGRERGGKGRKEKKREEEERERKGREEELKLKRFI